MKKLFYLVVALTLSTSFAACDKDDNYNNVDTEESLQVRAAALGFDNSEDYQATWAEQCAAGNHENCDILTNGTHQPCAYTEHSGTNHDGSHHNGTDHGTHDANGHSHQSHNDKNNGNHGNNHH